MTTDEKDELLRLASELSYLAIRYADLSPLLSCAEWDSLADQTGRDVVELIEQKIEKTRAVIEDEHGDHDYQYANTTRETV